MLKKLKTQRAKLFREAEALRGKDGKFKDDETREAFDVKMAEVEALDEKIQRAEAGDEDPEFIRSENPLGRTKPKADPDEDEERTEPNERDLGAKAERERTNGILDACKAARLPMSFARGLIDDGTVTLLEAQKRVFKELSTREDPNPAPNGGARRSSVEMGDDPFVHARSGIENALLHRLSPQHFKLEDKAREYRGMSMLDVAKAYLGARGIRITGMSKMDIAGAALGLTQVRGGVGMHTTSDFPLLLADVASKTLRAEYAAVEPTFGPITRSVSLSDFKPANRVQIGDAPALEKVLEHGEFKRGTIAEGREQIQLATYGKVFAITRQALINDDTDAFSRVPSKFGRSARNLESDLVWYQILSNPTMGDSVALFHATHGNYSGAGLIGVGTISDGEVAMMLQTGLDGVTLVRAEPKYLLVPPAQKTLALQFVSVNMQAQQVANVNPFAGRLIVIAEPRLQTGVTIGNVTAAGSATAWYLASSPDQVDILELATLDGQEGPVIESRVGFDVDGLEIKCRHDVGAKVIDHRGLYKNDGSDDS